MSERPNAGYIYPDIYVRSPVPPAGAVLDEHVYVEMRDGIRLCADIYRPPHEGRYPALLSLSPYSKDIQQQPPHWSHAIEAGATGFYVAHGYVHVIAQGRGCGRSQGQWRWFDEKERTDGCDLIEWIARQPWCDGNVGMIGDSYWSWSQYFAAAAQPPHLKCICQCDATTDLYRDACYPGGIFNATFMNQWIPYQAAMAAWPGPVEGKEPPLNLHWEIVNRPFDGAWWHERSARSVLDKIKVPVMSIAPQGGQMHFRGQLAGYPQIGAPKKLLIVPPTGFWSHLRYLTNRPLNLQMLRWFDHWLKGTDTGIMDEPEVAVFDSGTRCWRHADGYPSAGTQWTKFYVSGQTIGTASPGADEAPDVYRLPDSYAQLIAGKPVLAYQTEPLARPLRLGGPLSLTLFASSSRIDTLWFANLLDIAPNGRVMPLSRGMLRASFRETDAARSQPGQPWHPFTRMQPLEPGVVHEFQIEMRPLFHTFKTGHRLQLTIASEDIHFNNPLRQIDVQLLPWPVENAVHHSARWPTHLVLPVTPEVPEERPVASPVADIDWPLVPGQWMPDTDGHPLSV